VVLAGQVGTKDNPYTYWPLKQMEYIRKFHPTQDIDIFAIAPYYGANTGTTTQPITADQYIAGVAGWGTDMLPKIGAWGVMAEKFDKELWCYEAGSHTVKPPAGSVPAVLAAQKHPDFLPANASYLDKVRGKGVIRIIWFVACARNNKDYTWGATDNPNETTPKVQAVHEDGIEHPYK
jgi:hypothetical protein